MEPNILLGVLKNIQADLTGSGQYAPAMILKLSDLLSYFLYETDIRLVPLEKEMNMLMDYTGLKKLVFGDQLVLQIEVSGDFTDLMISPLVILPFLEMSMPISAPDSSDYFYSDIKIHLVESRLELIINTIFPIRAHSISFTEKYLEDANRNLQVRYPDRHVIKFEEIGNGFHLFMNLHLDTYLAAG
jgi:two-component system LytT family sensor kinase